jgi:hypothetical protein
MKAFKPFKSSKALRNFLDKHRQSPRQRWRMKERRNNLEGGSL